MGSMLLTTHLAVGVTVLCIDIKNFTAGCAEMSAGEVGEWVADFYELVDRTAAAYGVRKAEVRGDCCICVAGTAGTAPWAVAGEQDGPADQATRMLAFAADLWGELGGLACPGGRVTSVRMGVASGDVSFLVGDASAGPGGRGFMSVQGEAVGLAMRMEALSEPGTVLAHRSTAQRWAAEAAGRAAPGLFRVDGKSHGPQHAAAFDCAYRVFQPPPSTATLAGSSAVFFAPAPRPSTVAQLLVILRTLIEYVSAIEGSLHFV